MLLNIGGNRICGCSVVGVAGEIAVLNQFKAEGFSQGVAGAEQAFIALTSQQITERVPGQQGWIQLDGDTSLFRSTG